MRLTIALLVLGISASAAPQVPCAPGEARAKLRGADVEAKLITNGNLFFGEPVGLYDGYIVPLSERNGDNTREAVSIGNLWLTGRVGNEIRETAGLLTGLAYRPGVTGADGIPPDSTACAAADRIWTVARHDLDTYYETGVATQDLAEWPVELGAPVLDGDGDSTNYNLTGGDQPAIRGDVMAWWSLTDLAAPANYLTPVGVDVGMEAIAFHSVSPALATTTMYRATITNRSGQPLQDAYAALFMIANIGGYAGTDTTSHMFYYYGEDYWSFPQYGRPAPAFGAVVAEGPVLISNGRDDDRDGEIDEPGERGGLAASMLWYNGGGPVGLPYLPGEYFNGTRGKWAGGESQREFESGYLSRADSSNHRPMPTIFPGDPETSSFWSAMNTNRSGTPTSLGSNTREMLSTGPFALAPNESTTVTFALLYARGEDEWDSLRRLRARAALFRSLTASGTFDPWRVERPIVPVVAPALSVSRPRPNPFRGSTTIQLTGPPDTNVRVSVIDVLGRVVVEPTEHVIGAAPVDLELGAGLGPGTYIVRVTVPGGERSFVMTKLR